MSFYIHFVRKREKKNYIPTMEREKKKENEEKKPRTS